jgi:hypothetical protein
MFEIKITKLFLENYNFFELWSTVVTLKDITKKKSLKTVIFRSYKHFIVSNTHWCISPNVSYSPLKVHHHIL